MPEKEQNRGPLTPAQIKEDVYKYFKDTETGTPKHLALGEFLFLEEATELLQEARGQVNITWADPLRRAKAESYLRIEELKIAHLQKRIEDHQKTDPEYREAYLKLNTAWKKLLERPMSNESGFQNGMYFMREADNFIENLWDRFRGEER